MNTLEINNLLTRNSDTKKFYLGCFPSDKITSFSRYPYYIAVKTDPSYKKGEQWVGINVTSPHCVEYYDSFGVWPVKSGYIQKFLDTFQTVKYNNSMTQSITSNNCGKHVIYFILKRCKGVSFDNIVAGLKNKPKPDRVVDSFVQTMFFGKKYIK